MRIRVIFIEKYVANENPSHLYSRVLERLLGFTMYKFMNSWKAILLAISLTTVYGCGDDDTPLPPDTDGDGVYDSQDQFPEDASEQFDADSDGVGDNADAFPSDPYETVDTDSDGVGDNSDAFPEDATESADTDGDGIGDNADALPNDATETVDTDSDGVGDNSDNCVSDANADQADSDANGSGNACDPMPTSYTYVDSVHNASGDATTSSVSYTGQTARHLLIEGLTSAMVGLTERVGEAAAVRSELQFYITGEGVDDAAHGFSVDGAEPVIPGPNFGDVSTGKNLDGKIAGGDGLGGGETSRLIDDYMFGWNTGLDATPLPIELVNYFIERMVTESTDGNTPLIPTTADPAVPLDVVNVDANGLDYRQLTQKFLGVAVAFSQGTNDYFQTDFANSLGQEGTKNYGAGEHDFDEAFGYYGAARDIGDYTDDEAAGKGGRDGYADGYYDSNGDGSIDVRSEYVFGHAQNCAKRDRGSDFDDDGVNNTDFSQEVLDAFLIGRQIVANATSAGTMTVAEQTALDAQISAASLAWEKCIAATVVHYINDVVGDYANFDTANSAYADLSNFKDLAKHWGEMKGFALGLQFSPASPFRVELVEGITVADLRTVLRRMGDAPVLADGSQNGIGYAGPVQDAVDAYVADLLDARDILEAAYEFDSDIVAQW